MGERKYNDLITIQHEVVHKSIAMLQTRAAQMVGLVGPGPHHFLKLFLKFNVVRENNGDCGFQLSTKAIVTNTRWLINCD